MGHELTRAKHAARAGYQVRLYRPVLSSEGERRDHETPGVTKGSTANDRWVSNFDQFFVGRPVTLSLPIILQENLFLKVHMGEKP